MSARDRLSYFFSPSQIVVRGAAVMLVALIVVAAGTWLGHRVDPTWSRRHAAVAGARAPQRSFPFALPWFSFSDDQGAAFTPDVMRGRTWVITLWLPGCASPGGGGARRLAAVESALAAAGAPRDVSWLSAVGAADASGAWVRRRFGAEARVRVVAADSGALADLAQAIGLARSDADLAELVFGAAQPLFLVDRDGMVRAAYDASDPEAVELLARQLRAPAPGARTDD